MTAKVKKYNQPTNYPSAMSFCCMHTIQPFVAEIQVQSTLSMSKGGLLKHKS